MQFQKQWCFYTAVELTQGVVKYFIAYVSCPFLSFNVYNKDWCTCFAVVSTSQSSSARWMVMGLAGAPFGVVNAIQYSTDGRNLSFITVGWFEIHSCVALLAAWLGVNTSSAFSSLSSPSLFVAFLLLLFLRPCALIALKKNATFLISGQNKRKTTTCYHQLTS